MTLNSGSKGRGSVSGSESAVASVRRTVTASNKKPQPLTRETVQVDPETAKKWLESFNSQNRKLTWTNVRELAARMDRGEWHLNGECLKFDEHGNLFEGQHRLHAVVLHGKPVWFEVLRGLPHEDRFNDGGKQRTMADYLVIAGLVDEKRAIRAAAIVEVIASLLEGKPRRFRAANSSHKNEAIALCREYIKSINWAQDTFPGHAFSPLVGAFAFAYAKRPTVTDKFARYFLSGNRATGCVANLLDSLVAEANTTGRNDGSGRLELTRRILSAIYAEEKKSRLSVLRQNKAANAYFGAA